MNVLIIGNGIAGVSTALELRKHSDCSITIISGESDYFFSRTALMYIYMGHMRYRDTMPYDEYFWKDQEINLVRDWVEQVDIHSKKIICRQKGELPYDKLVIATGSKYRKPDWFMDHPQMSGLFSLNDLEHVVNGTKQAKKAVVVGGGLIGVELAEMFASRGIEVTYLVRELKFWQKVLPEEEANLLAAHMKKHGIDLHFGEEISDVLYEGERLTAIKTNKEEDIETDFIGLAIGVEPNIEFLKESKIAINKGVIIDAYLQTNTPDVYAVGDCAEMNEPRKDRMAIEQVWYTGRMQGETCAWNIAGKSIKYNPGNWFNSAKIFDIEYQVYCNSVYTPDDTCGHFYWENKNDEVSFRVAYDMKTNKVLYFSTLGIRLRHEVCDSWIAEGKLLDDVMHDIHKASFDPEFTTNYFKEIQMNFKMSKR